MKAFFMAVRQDQQPVDIFIDNHVHTSLCNHAVGTMEEYVLSAINKGLKKLVFLEHMEEGISSQKKTWLSEEDFDDYFTEAKRLQDKFEKHIEIGIGVECGYNPERLPDLIARLGKRQWDQIGISCHFIKLDGFKQHINLFSRSQDNLEMAAQVGAEKLLNSYFSLLTGAVQQLPGTMLCHLDGALRFLSDIPPIHETHLHQIDELLQAVKKKKMCLEINTSGLSIRQEPFPHKSILAMALARKIPVVLGSDAHHPLDVGNFFETMTQFMDSAVYQ